jgi:hypothetical protein
MADYDDQPQPGDERQFVRTLGISPLSDLERRAMGLGPATPGGWHQVIDADRLPPELRSMSDHKSSGAVREQQRRADRKASTVQRGLDKASAKERTRAWRARRRADPTWRQQERDRIAAHREASTEMA